MKIVYVNCVLISNDKKKIAYIFKQHGPEFLKNKYNFIGGKLNDTDNSYFEGAIREVKEESGVDIKLEHIHLINTIENEDFCLYNTVAIIPLSLLEQAYTAEKEPVYINDIEILQLQIKNNPNVFYADFEEILNNALMFY